MPLRAFVDDSGDTTNHRVLVLAGYIADTATWERFTNDWNELLQLSKLPAFKMADVGSDPERILKAGLFYRVIEEHVRLAVAVAIDLEGLKSAVSKYGLHYLANPYEHVYRALIDRVASNHDEFGLTEPVEFIFDKHTAEESVVDGYEEFAGYHPIVGQRQYPRPRFEDDRRYVPLQAADLFAWHVRRHWLRTGTLASSMPEMSWKRFQGLRYMAFDIGAEQIDATLAAEAERQKQELHFQDIEATISFSIDLSWPPKDAPD